MIRPPVWTTEDLAADRRIAIEQVRRERMEEPLEFYLTALDASLTKVEELLETTVDLSRLREEAPAILGKGDLVTVFRYLAGPPISLDDLEMLVDGKISRAQVRENPERARAAAQVVLDTIDRRRFPWVADGREPSEHEVRCAALATAALLAYSATSTSRRHTGKKGQEASVANALTGIGMTPVAPRRVETLADAPAPGEFCPETMLGTRKADFVVGLYDRRVLAVECKVSNSSVNSIKRLNNDAAVKAVTWLTEFGRAQVVPAAVMSGVYALHQLAEAQSRGLTLFWAHRLGALTEWVLATR